MQWRNFVCVLTPTLVFGCSRDGDVLATLGLHSPVTIRAIQPLAGEALGALVLHDAADRFPERVRYVSADLAENAVTPWHSADSSIVVLGLKPGQTYWMRFESRGWKAIDGPATSYTVPPLPAALTGVTIHLTGPMSGGYSMSPIAGLDDHGYVIIFDSVGTIRWYRDFGAHVFATEQQEDGHITAFVGVSDGFNMAAGDYVEVTPTGDSVRSVSAIGSQYTDPHELLESFDQRGNRRADYLFGYDFQPVDRTAIGGGLSDTIAVHQVLRINTAGKVDTLISGSEHRSASDDVGPPTHRRSRSSKLDRFRSRRRRDRFLSKS